MVKFCVLAQNHISFFYASILTTMVKNCLECALRYFLKYDSLLSIIILSFLVIPLLL